MKLSLRRSYSLAAFALASGLGAPAVAHADPPRDPAAAEVFFEKGRAAAGRKDWEQACRAFEQSEALEPAAGTLLNLGECRVHLGKIASAWQDFVEAVRELPPNDDRLPYAKKRAGELASLVPHLAIALRTGAPEGTKIRRNGVEMLAGMLGTSVPVDPGPVTVVVEAPGRAPATVELDLKEGESHSLEVAPGDPLPAAVPAISPAAGPTVPTVLPPAPAAAGRPPQTLRTVGIAATAVGAAGIVAGGITGILALSNAATYRSACPSYACTDPGSLARANSAANSARTFSGISTVAFIGGGVLGAAGLTLWLTHRSSGGVSGHRDTIGISALPGGATGVWRVTF